MQDPTDFGDIELEDKRAENTALERLLAEIYPTITKVQCTWKDRLKQGAKLVDFLDDINVLFSVPTPGVPRVYADTLAEMEQRLKMLRHKDPIPVHMYASKIFYRPPQASMTTLGNLLATICSGLWVSCHLKPTQRKLFYGLYSRACGRVMANRPTGGGLYIASGPAETGKSVAMQLFLSCMPNSLQNISDGRSERAFTAKNGGNTDPDLKVEVWDELTSLLGGVIGGKVAADAAIERVHPDRAFDQEPRHRAVRAAVHGDGSEDSDGSGHKLAQRRFSSGTVPGGDRERPGAEAADWRAYHVDVRSDEQRVGDGGPQRRLCVLLPDDCVASGPVLGVGGGRRHPRARDQMLLVFKVISNTMPGGRRSRRGR